ncbi:MAG: hypothetical protein AABX07_02270 [Nanoarchaeota archaeon]
MENNRRSLIRRILDRVFDNTILDEEGGIYFLRANGVEIKELELPYLTTRTFSGEDFSRSFRHLEARPFHDADRDLRIRVTGTYEYLPKTGYDASTYPHRIPPITKIPIDVVSRKLKKR